MSTLSSEAQAHIGAVQLLASGANLVTRLQMENNQLRQTIAEREQEILSLRAAKNNGVSMPLTTTITTATENTNANERSTS